MTSPDSPSPRTEAGKRLLAELDIVAWFHDGAPTFAEWLAAIEAEAAAIEAEAAALPQEWVEERRPEDDAECERLGCEDRTHTVHHRALRAAQEAPAPEGLRAALVDLTSAYHHERKHEGRWDRCQRPRCQNARLAMEDRGPFFAPPTRLSAGGATKPRPTLGNRPDVAKPRVAKATRGAKGAKP